MTDISSMSLEELNQEIKAVKQRLGELRKARIRLSNQNSLFNEGQEFIWRGLAASENLRKTNPKRFKEKCIEAGFGADREFYGLNRCHHAQKWEIKSRQACYHASHGRVYSAKHLTEEEMKYAKIYALAFVKEWVEFWEGDIRDESRKKN